MNIEDDFYKFVDEELSKVDLEEMYINIKESETYSPNQLIHMCTLTIYKILQKKAERHLPEIGMLSQMIEDLYEPEEKHLTKLKLMFIVSELSRLNTSIGAISSRDNLCFI